MVEELIRGYGETISLTILGFGTWKVPRHYIALHGVKGTDIPELARRFGWLKVA
jgi:hypothetical protein